jgi:hypothetical protein
MVPKMKLNVERNALVGLFAVAKMHLQSALDAPDVGFILVYGECALIGDTCVVNIIILWFMWKKLKVTLGANCLYFCVHCKITVGRFI